MKQGFALVLLICLGCSDSKKSDAAQPTDGGKPATDAAAAQDAAQPANCPDDALAAGDHTLAFEHDGVTRKYLLHVPEGLPEAAPLVVNFHGFSSNASEQRLFSNMNVLADAKKFAVAYPEGVKGDFDSGTRSGQAWNAGTCCTSLDPTRDDLGFSRKLVTEIESKLCVDKRRVFATGMSNGGFMSHKLACSAADVFAAFAPVSGRLVVPADECKPSRPVPILMFNGTADSTVPYEASDDFQSAADTLAAWKEKNGCTGEPTETFNKGAATCATYDKCEAGVEVTLCTLEGMEHCWPGQAFCPSGATNVDLSANEAMWDFFVRFPLP